MVTASVDVEEQVLSAKRGALVLEAPDLALITVRGSERQTWLNGLLTCDLGYPFTPPPPHIYYPTATTRRLLAPLPDGSGAVATEAARRLSGSGKHLS